MANEKNEKTDKGFQSVVTLQINLVHPESQPATQAEADAEGGARLLEYLEISGRQEEVFKRTAKGNVIEGSDGNEVVDQAKAVQVFEELIRAYIFNAVANRRAERAANQARGAKLQKERLS